MPSKHQPLFDHHDSGCGCKEFSLLDARQAEGNEPKLSVYQCRKCPWWVIVDDNGVIYGEHDEEEESRKSA